MGVQCLDTLTTGANNSGFGRLAGTAVTSGANNTMLGNGAGQEVTTGVRHTLLGDDAAIALVTGNDCIAIGHGSELSATNAASQIAMGTDVTCVGNGNFTFGSGTSDSNIANGATSISAPSDIRLKEDIQDEEVGLAFIKDLRPVTFLWKKEKDCPSHMKVYKEDSEERVMNGKYNHGFIAQEVKEVINNHNLKEGFDMWAEDEADGRQRIGEAALMSVMVKAVQELSTTVDELKQELKTLKGE